MDPKPSEPAMLIAIVDIVTRPEDRPAALAQLYAERSEVRAMSGCVDFRVFASGEDATSATILHAWEDETSFASYLESAAFARSGEIVRPLLTCPPVSRRFHAELAETVN